MESQRVRYDWAANFHFHRSRSREGWIMERTSIVTFGSCLRGGHYSFFRLEESPQIEVDRLLPVRVGKPLFFPFGLVACEILVPWPGIKLVLPAVKVQSLNHWTTREIPGKPLPPLDHKGNPREATSKWPHSTTKGQVIDSLHSFRVGWPLPLAKMTLEFRCSVSPASPGSYHMSPLQRTGFPPSQDLHCNKGHLPRLGV